MSDEQLASFWEAIQVNESLQDKLQDVTNLEDIATIAQAEGFDISASELTKARANLTELVSANADTCDASLGAVCRCEHMLRRDEGPTAEAATCCSLQCH